MSGLKADKALALQLLMNEDLYLVDPVITAATQAQTPPANPVEASGNPAVSVAEPASFDYLGENNKYLAILVNYPDHQYMAPKELEALLSILSAKKMTLNDVAIVNLSKNAGLTFSALKRFLVSSGMVLFGINPQSIGLPGIASNQISQLEGLKVLATFSFTEMMVDVEKKKVFWNVMKTF